MFSCFTVDSYLHFTIIINQFSFSVICLMNSLNSNDALKFILILSSFLNAFNQFFHFLHLEFIFLIFSVFNLFSASNYSYLLRNHENSLCFNYAKLYSFYWECSFLLRQLCLQIILFYFSNNIPKYSIHLNFHF